MKNKIFKEKTKQMNRGWRMFLMKQDTGHNNTMEFTGGEQVLPKPKPRGGLAVSLPRQGAKPLRVREKSQNG